MSTSSTRSSNSKAANRNAIQPTQSSAPGASSNVHPSNGVAMNPGSHTSNTTGSATELAPTNVGPARNPTGTATVGGETVTTTTASGIDPATSTAPGTLTVGGVDPGTSTANTGDGQLGTSTPDDPAASISTPSTPTAVAGGSGNHAQTPATPLSTAVATMSASSPGTNAQGVNSTLSTAPFTPPPNATNAVVVFNAQFAQQQLMTYPQYVASGLFPGLGTWRLGVHDTFAVQGPPNGPIESVRCIVVGILSREKAFLGTNGTFNPRFSDPLKNARAAKWQATLDAPVDNVHFGPDWSPAITNLQTVQGEVARTTDKRHFILPGQRLRLGRNIWMPKDEANDTPQIRAITNNYPISTDCAQWWDLVKETHVIDLMPVYDVNENLNTEPARWESMLLGALVEVTFTLKHYYMGANTHRSEAYDVFSARIESISILEKPAPILRSPFEQRVSTTKPRVIPQSPQSAIDKGKKRATEDSDVGEGSSKRVKA